ncbi:hypothetical protein EIP86_007496 [Pleurotus ostreatoroseus]|nr:hypothetical protein EIP86_007496 [Pleurotus ostreatoroseus]
MYLLRTTDKVWKRCTVTAIEQLVLHGNTCKRFYVIEDLKGDGTHFDVNLWDEWFHTSVSVGDIVNIIGAFSSAPSLSSVPQYSIDIDRKKIFLILHPDVLIAATSLARASSCRRRPLLQEWVQPSADVTPPLIWGNVLHELVQICLQNGRWEEDFVEAKLGEILRANLGSLLGINITIEDAIVAIKERASGLQKHMSAKSPRSVQDIALCTQVVDLEWPVFDDVEGPVVPEHVPVANNIGHLNHPQQQSIRKVLTAHNYALIHGPPGTGETTVIAAIVKCIISSEKLKDGKDFRLLILGNQDKVHPESKSFTLSALSAAESVEQLEQQVLTPPVVATICLALDHAISAEEFQIDDSFQNMQEVRLILQLVECLLLSGIREDQMGIISLYRQQIKLPREGSEKGCIIVSLARSNDCGIVGVTVHLNERFRQVPTFGRGTIRRFGTNVAGQKQFAARDYEDVLQCVIPCIEGLLDPKLERIVMDLLWFMLMWHALAKLRLQTETTVNLLEGVTTSLGRAVRKFARTVEDIKTYELPKEHAARKRREAAQSQANGSTATSTFLGRKIKKFSLLTFKWHDLGHLVRDILNFGTSDVYSTQAGESEHRRIKKLYTSANKKNVEKQIATKQQRQVTLKKITECDEVAIQARKEAASATFTTQGDRKRGRPRKAHVFGLDANEQEDLPAVEYTARYQISGSQSYWEDIRRLAAKDPEDPALENFIPNLKDHLLSRLRGDTFDGEEHSFTSKDRRHLSIVGDRIYKHTTLRINYTTYDMRRSQDSINPRTHADIMVLNPGEDRLSHPYWYGRVCGIVHADVTYTGPGLATNTVRRIDFLWVRWFGPEPGARNNRSPFKTCRLPRIGFVPADVSGAFSFLDPTLVIRGVHLIPAFAHGRITSLMGPSILRRAKERDMDVGNEDTDPNSDWEGYYVNIFVDRDMIMRYLGGGIGHILLRGVINSLEIARTILGQHDETEDGREEDTAIDVDDGEKLEDVDEDEEAYLEQLFDEGVFDDDTAAEFLEDMEHENVEEDGECTDDYDDEEACY